MVIGIIGGGASGMAAALSAAENPNAKVILMERQARVGRKLLATGNGRCNLTNMHAAQRGYHGDDAHFSDCAIAQFDPASVREWFAKLGLYTVIEESGRVYPYSDQANSVVDVLRLALMQENIELKTGFDVQKIRVQDGKFCVSGEEESVICDKLIVACGGLAGTKLGGSMAGYKLLGKLSHKSTRLRPALVQLKCNWSALASLKGVRANANVQILRDGALFAQSRGEVQFTEYGLSGPVIFEISRDVGFGEGKWECRLDMLAQWSEQMLFDELIRRKQRDLPTDELLTGILHNRLGRVITKAVGISANQASSMLTDAQLQSLAHAVKDFVICVTEPMGMDCAQVTAGGVCTDQFDPQTMQSRLVPGLYACGEVLDVDGDCGGYNLQWAWSSGRCAGLHAGKENV